MSVLFLNISHFIFLGPGPELEIVHFDVSMTFDFDFQDDLNDRQSNLHREISAIATAALLQMLNTTTAKLEDEAAIMWSFSEGSVVATASDVAVTNVQNADEVTGQLNNFDVSTVPNLQRLTITPTRKIYFSLTIHK